mgnify:CR=1 FL=1|jgi:plasmid stabilization system protein ParE
MRLALQQSDYFWADLQKQVDWYRDNANSKVAEHYIAAVEATLKELTKTPGLGRPRFQDLPELAGLHSWRVHMPFHRHLIFYRFNDKMLSAERVLHGARDLTHRLKQTP